MDYSHLAHDPDHPEGTSPWNTSPQHSARPSFSGNNDLFPSPLPGASEQSKADAGNDSPRSGDEGDGQIAQDAAGSANSSTPAGGPAATSTGAPPEQAAAIQASGLQQHPKGVPHSGQDGLGRQQIPARYQGGGRVQRSGMPSKKLQARITGLERTGRKDPILRFDVHVSQAGKRLTSMG